jgi:glycosyltransferase involved in cell wall biosynthesis
VTGIAPLLKIPRSLVIHMKTMHAYSASEALGLWPRTYRRMTYPRTVRLADAIVVNSESLRSEVEQYLDVDTSKMRLVYEAIDHKIFKPGDAAQAKAKVAEFGVTKPFVLFVSSLWEYKNADGLLRAFAHARGDMGDRQLVIVGHGRDAAYTSRLHALAAELGIAGDVVFTGGVPLQDTTWFYRATDVFVYPSFNETFGLPILEAMACGCPVVTSDTSSMPETAGGAAVLCDPADPASIAKAVIEVLGQDTTRLREAGLRRAAEFTWAAAAAQTLDVYRDVAERRRRRAGQAAARS